MKGFALDETGDVLINNLENLNKISREPAIFEGKTTQTVIEQGRNLLNIDCFSANPYNQSISTANAYGTTISTTDGKSNSVTVTQSKWPNTTSVTSFTNGFFDIRTSSLTYGKTYTISFDYEIVNNPLNVNSVYIMPGEDANYGSYISLTGVSGRASANMNYKYETGCNCIEFRMCGISCVMSNIMVTIVGESTNFEPYIEPCPTPTNPSPLVSKVHNETQTGKGLVLNGIGDTKDVLTINRFYGTAELTKRCGVIEKYNGETITTDYMSTTGELTTGELTTGVKVVYVLPQPIMCSIPYQDPGISCDIEMVEGNELLAQTMQKVIGTNKGEWFLNVNEGIRFSNILIKKPIEDLIRDEIQSGLTQVDSSFMITDFTYNYNKEKRELKVNYTAKNSQGQTIKGAGEWH